MNNQYDTSEKNYLGGDLPKTTLVDKELNNEKSGRKKTSKFILKLIIGLFLLAILIAGAIFVISKLQVNPNNEINDVSSTIDQSLNQITDNDFTDNLDVNFVDQSTMTTTGKQVDTSINDIDSMLRDLNNQNDFKDFGSVNFNE